MVIQHLPNLGNKSFCLNDMDESDLRSLHAMIKSACLTERREWNGIKQQIEMILDA